MSTNGLVLTIPATVIQSDILITTFRYHQMEKEKIVKL